MAWIQKIIHALDRLNDWVGRSVAWLLLGMTVITFAVAGMRYFFSIGWIAVQESVIYLHALLFMLGIGYTLLKDEHVRVDVFYRAARPRTQAWVNLLGGLLLLFPTCVFLFWISWEYVVVAWQVKEGSREAGGLNLVYLLKGIMLLMPVLLFLQGLAEVLRQGLFLFGPPPAQPHHHRHGHRHAPAAGEAA